jgi:GNAT superfamily N-acetyltransferase
MSAGELRAAREECRIETYGSASAGEVAELLAGLNGWPAALNLSYLRWKYEMNPRAPEPLGVEAREGARLVGFRGYFTSQWRIRGRPDRVVVLCPGDTYVLPSHRKKGLSVAMGRTAMESFAGRGRVFLNTSCTLPSLPGYLRMGFAPLASKRFLTKCGVVPLAGYLLTSSRRLPIPDGKISFGRQGDFAVSDCPRPAEMAALAAGAPPGGARIALDCDESFFRWRFSNPLGRYVFYYLMDGESCIGYLVVGLSPNARRAYILDWAPGDSAPVKRLFEFLAGSGHFDLLSILEFSLSADLVTFLRRLGFSAAGPMSRLERWVKGDLPLLVRPSGDASRSESWMLEGLDLRKAESWSIRGICSDAT